MIAVIMEVVTSLRHALGPLKMMDFVSWLGERRRASGVDTVVHEHCEPAFNAAMGQKTHF
jgi:hypothetical protein